MFVLKGFYDLRVGKKIMESGSPQKIGWKEGLKNKYKQAFYGVI